MRIALKILGTVVALYLVLSAALFAIMRLPPVRFAGIIAYAPGPLFMVLPFEPLWSIARGGVVHTGDAAPDFELPTLDQSSLVRLSSFRGQRPVVLIFGSYT